MRFTVLWEVGWCGFGRSNDLVPELRLGFIRIACCRGSIVARILELRSSLQRALDELRKKKGD